MAESYSSSPNAALLPPGQLPNHNHNHNHHSNNVPSSDPNTQSSPVKSRRTSPPNSTTQNSPPSSTPSSVANTNQTTVTKRGVRNLNPEQLAKKRQNDRDAQRAIRERTKNQIETLEKRVKELESGQAYQHLQDVIREKEALREENESIRGKLHTVMGLLNPIVDKSDVASDDASQSMKQEYSDRPAAIRRISIDSRSASGQFNDFKSPTKEQAPSSYRSSYHQNPLSPQPQIPDRTTPHFAPSSPSSTSTSGRHRQHVEYGNHYRPIEGLLNHRHSQSRHTSAASSPQPPHNPTSPPDSTQQWPPQAAGQKRPLSALSQSPRSTTFHAPQSIASPSAAPYWAQTPQHTIPVCHLDIIFDDFIRESRQRLHAGLPMNDLVPADIDFKPLIYGGKTITDKPTARESSLAVLLADIMKGFSNVDGWPEKIGKVVIVFYYLRWLIHPTQEHYEMMPRYMRPVEEQLRFKHPMWMDMVPWPEMRAKMACITPPIPLIDFFPPYTLTLCLNWPYGGAVTGCLSAEPSGNGPSNGSAHRSSSGAGSYRNGSTSSAHSDPTVQQPGWPSRDDDQELRITPTYWAHINQLENWSLGKGFGEAIPPLAHTYRIKEKDGERGNRERDTRWMGQS